MSVREALESRFDELEAGAEPVEVQSEELPETPPAAEAATIESTPATDTPVEAKDDRPRNPDGTFKKAPPSATITPGPKKGAADVTAAPAKGAATGTGVPAAAPVPTDTLKPPQSLKPSARELWGKLPPEFKPLLEDFARREKETTLAIQKAAEAGKGASTWTETIRPFEAQIRAMGQEPTKYVGTLLQTAHQLAYGPPQQKAEMLADIIAQYGVSPQDLDAALVRRIQGGGMQQAPQQQAPYRDPRVDQLFQTLEQAKTQREQQAMEEAAATAEKFGESHEFFGDVREEMADLLEVWGKRGLTQPTEQDLERAYNIVCSNNAEIAAVLEQRKAAEAARTTQQATARAKVAAKSITTQPTAAPAAQPAGRRAALEAAYDEIASR